MRRNTVSFVVSMVLVVGLALAAGAGGFHFKSFSFAAGSLTFNGVGVGLGNTDYVATLDATATVRAMCVNKGGNAAPGRNDLQASVPGPQDQIINTQDNGQTEVSLTVEDPSIVHLDEPPSTKKDCPNGKWTITDVFVVEWTSAHLSIAELGTGEVLFDQQYACSGGGAALDGDGLPISDGMGGYLVNPISCVEA